MIVVDRTGVRVQRVSSEHGFDDFNVEYLPFVKRVCVPKGIKKGDIFNVYCEGGSKYGATWKGDITTSLEHFAETNSLYQEMCVEKAKVKVLYVKDL